MHKGLFLHGGMAPRSWRDSSEAANKLVHPVEFVGVGVFHSGDSLRECLPGISVDVAPIPVPVFCDRPH